MGHPRKFLNPKIHQLEGELTRSSRSASGRTMGKTQSTSDNRVARAGAGRDPKLQGELVELAFLHKAVSLGFAVAKPYGDSARYDFIVDYRDGVARQLLRVQVKSTGSLHQGAYRIWCSCSCTRRDRRTYTPGQIDFLVAHVIPENAWYIFPIAVIGTRTCIKLFTHHRRSRSRYEEYREAWRLMSDSRATSSAVESCKSE